MSDAPLPLSRRSFLTQMTAAATILAVNRPALLTGAAESPAARGIPWFQRTARWGQTNLTEIDPIRFDLGWWRSHWRRTRVQGVVINAGGIVAYYPTNVPNHRRALHLGERDLFGELCGAAREEGLAIFARMDSNRADAAFYREHPDWFAHDADGKPYIVTGLYVACVNSPYYREHIPAILREVATRYRPNGFTDNNWNGPMRDQPCFCVHCEQRFRERTGHPVPRQTNWDDRVYREWIMWNYARRLEIWDEFNRTTRDAGGPDCIWVGMMAGAQNWQSRVFRDDREVYRRTEMIMLDHQRRFDADGFQHNGETGKRLHSVGGWDKLIPESMAMYHLSEHNFRLAAKPEPEVRLWALDGIAGGVQPWWHHVGSDQQDRRMLGTAVPVWQWHERYETYLLNRTPVATVGLLWSQRNMDFFGRDDGGAHVDDPWNGFTQALIRARIPYVPVHVDDIDRLASELGLRVLVLPNLGALSDQQISNIQRFLAAGGSIVATGASSLFDEWGQSRPDLALANVFGASVPPDHPWRNPERRTRWAKEWVHTYLRLTPELRAGQDGPVSGVEPPARGARHEILKGFEATDILAFGGELAPLQTVEDAQVLATYIPPVPIAPAESVWMRQPSTSTPAIVIRELPSGGRSAYLPADVDRRFARDLIPDHGELLARVVRWAAKVDMPLTVEGRGLLDCHLYRQGKRFVLHVVNLTNANTWRTPVHELIPVGPIRISLDVPETAKLARSLVTNRSVATEQQSRGAGHTSRITFQLDQIVDHEVIVIE